MRILNHAKLMIVPFGECCEDDTLDVGEDNGGEGGRFGCIQENPPCLGDFVLTPIDLI